MRNSKNANHSTAHGGLMDWAARTLISRMKPNEVEQTSLEAASAIGRDRALAISTDSTGGTSRGSRIGAGRLFGRMRRLDTWWYQPRSRPWSSIFIYFRLSLRLIAIKDILWKHSSSVAHSFHSFIFIILAKTVTEIQTYRLGLPLELTKDVIEV